MLDIVIVIICLIINAFFSAYETAFVTVSKDEIEELQDTKKLSSSLLASFKKKPERSLSIILIGITLVGAIAGAVLERLKLLNPTSFKNTASQIQWPKVFLLRL